MDNIGLILALAKRGGGVGSAMTLGKGTENEVTLTAAELKQLVRNQDVRTWWESAEPVTVNYYGATITQEGNVITINGTMTGDNSEGEDTNWEDPTEHEEDTMLDLTRSLKRMDKTDPLLLYLEPYHLYRVSCAVISGSMTVDEGGMTSENGSMNTLVGVKPIGLFGRYSLGAYADAERDTEIAPYAGEARLTRYEPRNNTIAMLEELEIPYDIHGGSLALVMPNVREGASYTFDNYKVAVSFTDVTGLGGYKLRTVEKVEHDDAKY